MQLSIRLKKSIFPVWTRTQAGTNPMFRSCLAILQKTNGGEIKEGGKRMLGHAACAAICRHLAPFQMACACNNLLDSPPLPPPVTQCDIKDAHAADKNWHFLNVRCIEVISIYLLRRFKLWINTESVWALVKAVHDPRMFLPVNGIVTHLSVR
jgi:hypothetical protein